MASDLALSRRPSSAFTAAAAFLTSVSAYSTASGMRSPEMRKKRRERSVCAPHSRSAGTSIGPKLSFSMRLPLIAAVMLLLQRAAQRPRAGLGAPGALQLPAFGQQHQSPPLRRQRYFYSLATSFFDSLLCCLMSSCTLAMSSDLARVIT